MKKTKKKETTISFVMPAYNDGDSIEKAIKSIKDQDLPGIEMIVVNDGSTDDTKKILDGLKDKGLIDNLIHLTKNEGACVARNKGAKLAKGKYLSFLPADAILYPGTARIWYETLEDNPDYDFLYGGYEFITEDGERIDGQQYSSNTFEPYLLDVTNYIDGSFPIRTESFWKYAEIMNQPDGLWDSKIKSLQDWDFWLSVVRNGGKGIYMQDFFFGTTMPHKGGLSDDSANNWLDRTEAIKAKHNIPIKKLCVASLGAGFHAKRLAYILGADFKEMPSFKPHRYDAIYSIGFYPEFAKQQGEMFLNDYYNNSKGMTSARKLVHFVGSDIWQMYHLSLASLEVWNRYFKDNNFKVIVEFEHTKEELRRILGIEAEVIPLPPLKLFNVMPMPKEFTVACYMPAVNNAFYRPNEMYEIAKRLPDVKFKFFGHPTQIGKDHTLPQNIEFMGYINDMESFIKDCSAIMRFPMHDGLPVSVLEFLLAGRYSIQNVPVKYTQYIPTGKNITEADLNLIVDSIKQLKEHIEKNGVNQAASDYWREELNHDKYKERVMKLAKYDPKEYWEERAESWVKQANIMPIEVDEVKKVFEKSGAKSVVDIGCGDGRWYKHLKDWGVEKYKGIDISSKLIDSAKIRFPYAEFEAVKVEDYKPTEKVDLIFSYTCLEHITAEEWDKAKAALKGMADKLLLIEPTNFISRDYCHSHDYEKDFKVIDKVQLKDKVILLCDLK